MVLLGDWCIPCHCRFLVINSSLINRGISAQEGAAGSMAYSRGDSASSEERPNPIRQMDEVDGS